jgi:hypothetical protein
VFVQSGVDHLKDDDRVVAVLFLDVHDLALHVSEQIFQDWGGSFALRKRLAVQRVGSSACAGEKFLGEIFLAAVEDVQSGNTALAQAREKAAVLADCGHDQRRFEGSLRDPSYRCSGGTAALPGGKDVHAIREEPESFLLYLRVHGRGRIVLHSVTLAYFTRSFGASFSYLMINCRSGPGIGGPPFTLKLSARL